MSLDLFPLMPGDVTTSVSVDGHRGRQRTIEDLLFKTPMLGGLSVTAIHGTSVLRLVKCSSTFSCAPGAVVLFNDATANTVQALAGAAADKATVAGFALLPPGTTSITTGQYFWVVCNGPTIAIANATFSALTELAVKGASGGIDASTVTTATTVAWSLGAAGSTGAIAVRATLIN